MMNYFYSWRGGVLFLHSSCVIVSETGAREGDETDRREVKKGAHMIHSAFEG